MFHSIEITTAQILYRIELTFVCVFSNIVK